MVFTTMDNYFVETEGIHEPYADTIFFFDGRLPETNLALLGANFKFL